ncbi:MAG TPA: hypothetical protein VFU47_02165, partial [Armatimonadota bacterium]|nr:hypothetical protein [Armatimonadota bacterium]
EAILAEGAQPETVTEASPSAERGASHLPEAARRGGRAIVEKYGSEHMAAIGRKGSRAVVKKYGLRFYSEIAARNRGVKKRRKAEDGA